MKIDTDGSRALTTDSVTTTKPANIAATTRTSDTTPAAGSVRISEASRSLQASGTNNAEAPFDANRVEAIKAAIAAGQFKVDPEAIADRMLGSAGELLVVKA